MNNRLKNRPIPALTQKQIDRFFSLVEQRGEDECWPWHGVKTDSGYGKFHLWRATRIMLVLATGDDPGELFAIHLCENRPDTLAPACVNPNHLKAGTHLENMSYRTGEFNTAAKLTEDQVRKILKLRSEGVTTLKMAEMFGVTSSMISHICTGRSWGHLSIPRDKHSTGGYRMTKEQIRQVFDLREKGLSQQKIADTIGCCSQVNVSVILRKGKAHFSL